MMQKIIATISTMLLSMVMLLSSIDSASAMPIVSVQSTTMATIYIGNLSDEVTEEDFRGVFADYGSVKSVQLGIDCHGRLRECALLEMSTEEEEAATIYELDQVEWFGKEIQMMKANPREYMISSDGYRNRRG